MEVKAGARVSSKDARHLRDLQSLLDKPLRLSLVLSMDRDARMLEAGIWALPVAWALGGDEEGESSSPQRR